MVRIVRNRQAIDRGNIERDRLLNDRTFTVDRKSICTPYVQKSTASAEVEPATLGRLVRNRILVFHMTCFSSCHLGTRKFCRHKLTGFALPGFTLALTSDHILTGVIGVWTWKHSQWHIVCPSGRLTVIDVEYDIQIWLISTVVAVRILLVTVTGILDLV